MPDTHSGIVGGRKIIVAFRLNIDPRKAEQNLRGAISLPHGTGRTVRVLVIAKDAKAKEALAAGADYAGDTEYLEKIKKYEKCCCSSRI
mgnify:CR=1 FL=1